MIGITGLFETHLPTRDLDRAMAFYRDILGLPLAHRVPERGAAFLWIGEPGRAMLGLWQGTSILRMQLHLAFAAPLEDVLALPGRLRAAGVAPLGFDGEPTDEPAVIGWMPAAAVFCADPDGHSVEVLSILPAPPRPDLGVVGWSRWRAAMDGGVPGDPAGEARSAGYRAGGSPMRSPQAAAEIYLAAFNARDAAERLALLEQVWGDGSTYTDPSTHLTGREALSAYIADLLRRAPGARYVFTGAVETHHGMLRFGWRLVGPDGSVLRDGVDFGEIAPDGRLRQIVGFVEPPPVTDEAGSPPPNTD